MDVSGDYRTDEREGYRSLIFSDGHESTPDVGKQRGQGYFTESRVYLLSQRGLDRARVLMDWKEVLE
jgi:hypothetical protein